MELAGILEREKGVEGVEGNVDGGKVCYLGIVWEL